MELESLNFDSTEILPKIPENLYSEDAEEYVVIDSIMKDNKSEFVFHAKRLFVGENLESERSEALKLLNACCGYDSLNCASSVINGDVGSVPYNNDVAADTGHSPLHTAAVANSPRCVEMLLKRRARTDTRSKDARALLPLELSLCNVGLDVTWNPSGDSIGDLILLLGDKDLTVVKLLAERTKEVHVVAHAYARAGAIVPLTALPIVATDKIREATVALIQDDDSVSKPKATIYESVIHEALCSNSSKRMLLLLLREIGLLQHFGAAVFSESVDKQSSPLISIVQAGDEAVLELLINTNIDVNETDAEGNTVIHCSLKGSSVTHKQQTRIMNLLIVHGARVSQKNKLGLSAVHFAAANGNISALEILLAANPELVHAKTVIKETPLFFAVKNNHLELLLGASTEILNLRKQRPIELTQSQDVKSGPESVLVGKSGPAIHWVMLPSKCSSQWGTSTKRCPSAGWSNGGGADWKRNRPPRTPGSENNLAPMFTATRQPLDMFTSEEQDLLSDVKPVMWRLRKILHQSRYTDGEPISDEDKTFVLEQMLNFHPDKDSKLGSGLTIKNIESHVEDMRKYGIVKRFFHGLDPVGLLAATDLSNPPYKAVLDSTPSSNSSWELTKNMDPIFFALDWENCRKPKSMRTCRDYPLKIRTFLEDDLGWFGPLKIFVAACERQFKSKDKKKLEAQGVTFIKVKGNKKNAADDVIDRAITDWSHSQPPPANLFLTSGDKGFAETVTDMQGKRYNVAVGYIEASAHRIMKALPCRTFCWRRQIMRVLR